MRKRRASPEAQIQRAVFQHLEARGVPGMFAWHTPNGGFRRRTEAAILKAMGVKAGVPDIIAVHKGRIYALELKAPGGRTSEKQHATIMALGAAGAFCAVAEGLDRALGILEMWGLLRGSAAVLK